MQTAGGFISGGLVLHFDTPALVGFDEGDVIGFTMVFAIFFAGQGHFDGGFGFVGIGVGDFASADVNAAFFFDLCLHFASQHGDFAFCHFRAFIARFRRDVEEFDGFVGIAAKEFFKERFGSFVRAVATAGSEDASKEDETEGLHQFFHGVLRYVDCRQVAAREV